VHDDDRVGDFAAVVFDGLTEGDIVDIQLRKGGLAALEGEVFDLKISFRLVRVGCGGGLLRGCVGGKCEENDEEEFRGADFIVS
jgi:hypothetical protein